MDLRIQKTHKALYNSFFELLNEKKFDAITVNDLCEHSMIRRATFYKHFEDKYDFFGFFIRQIKLEMNKKAFEEYEESSFTSLHLYLFEECIDFFNKHDKLIKNIMGSNVFHTLLCIFSEEIYKDMLIHLKTLERDNPNHNIPYEIFTSFYVGGIVQILNFWLNNKKNISEEYLINSVKTILNSIEFLSKSS